MSIFYILLILSKRKIALLALFFEPTLQPWGTPLESDVTSQPDAGNAIILRSAIPGVIPNP